MNARLSAFADEMEKIGTFGQMAGIGAGVGGVLNLGARAKAQLGLDYHPNQKGRTLLGDIANGALAGLSVEAIKRLLAKGSLK